MKLTNYKQLRKAIKPGTVITMVSHKFSEANERIKSVINVPRKVMSVDHIGISIQNPDGKNSWLQWGLSKNIKCKGNTFTILANDKPFITYRIELCSLVFLFINFVIICV